jgi:signal peptidase
VTATSPPRRRDLRKAREKSLAYYIGTAVSAAVLLIVLVLAVLVAVLPAVAGGSALTVLTQSMEPKLPPGTLIIIRATPVDDIRIGDVVTYQVRSNEPAVISHRVISRSIDTKGATTFIVKGDNNTLPDPLPVKEAQIRGTLWYSLPWLGYVNNAIGGGARSWLVPGVAGALFLYAAVLLVRWARDRHRKKSAVVATAVSPERSRRRSLPPPE